MPSLILQLPEAFVESFNFFNVQEPEADQFLTPRELEEISAVIRYELDGCRKEDFHFTVGIDDAKDL